MKNQIIKLLSIATVLLITLTLNAQEPQPAQTPTPQTPESTHWTKWQNSLQPAGTAAAELTLARNRQSKYQIIIPQKSTGPEKKAAGELQNWLKKITDVQLPIIPEPIPQSKNPKIISIGQTQFLQNSDLELSKKQLDPEGYGIATKDDALLLWGGKGRGVINAVFALLEEDLGCRWYTAEHAKIPHQKNLTFTPTSRTYQPQLKLRDPFYFVSFNSEWSLPNRTNAPSAPIPPRWGGNLDYGGLFVHTFHALLSPDKYFKDHPEYFMLGADGQRNSHQLCTTNPEVAQLVIKEVRRFLQKNPDTEIISVSKMDGGRTCLCENCKALDDAEGSNMAALLHLVNQVAEAIEEDHPDVTISTLAYLETIKVPKTMRPRKNVAIRLCNDMVGSWAQPFTPAAECEFGRLLESWSAVHDRIYIWDYVVNFSHYMAPMPNFEVVAKNIKFMVDNHAEGIMTQGAYQSTGAEREWMRSWVFAKLLWDPSRDVQELMQDFIWGHYGKAAEAIVKYNELLQNHGKKYAEELAKPAGGIRYEMDNPFLDKEFLTQATVLFDKGEEMAENEPVFLRVEQTRLPIMYVKLMRGPEFVGESYGEVLDRFEKIAKRVQVTHLREGGPDLEEKLANWKKAWEQYQEKASK